MLYTPEGCVLYLDLRKPVGDKLLDYSGNGNHGVIYGARLSASEPCEGLVFDGVDDYVRVPYSDVLYAWKDNSPCTFEVLVKPMFPIPPGEQKVILQYEDDVGVGRTMISVYVDGYWYSYFGARDLKSSVKAVKDAFTLVHLVYDGSKLKMYVDGLFDVEHARSVDEGKVGDLLIATHKRFTAYWHGSILLVRIYNRALTPQEVKKCYEDIQKRILRRIVATKDVTVR